MLLSDFLVVVNQSNEAIRQAMTDGQAKYSNSEWRTLVNAEDHIAHAYAHLQGAKGSYGPERLKHLQHALCRIAMALWWEKESY